MIIRETEEDFICIEQNHHAHIAKRIIAHWQTYFLADDLLADSVLYAVKQHDVGWHYFDKQPLWNDQTNKPYTFIDLPLLIKTVLYTKGVDIVERKNPYAAALCSAHYTKFLQKYEIREVQQYVEKEYLRRKRILQAFPEVDEATFERHLAFIQLADNLSLYICLHDPGNNDDKHRYFQSGIRIPEPIDEGKVEYLTAHWNNEQTIQLKNIENVPPFSIDLQEKTIPKNIIKEDGFLNSYEQVTSTLRRINFVG